MNVRHPSLEDLSALFDGELHADAASVHVHGCAVCRRRLVEMREVDALVLEAAASRSCRRTPRLPLLVAALVILAAMLGFGWSLPTHGDAHGELALLAVQQDLLDGLELQVSGLSLSLDDLDGAPEAQGLMRELTELRAGLSALQREYGDRGSYRR